MTISPEKKDLLLRCNKCGFCLAHCPVYKVTGVEWTAARGRIALIRGALLDEQLELGEIRDSLSNCLTCNACVDDCPAGVQTAEIIFNTREELKQRSGGFPLSSLVFRRLLASHANLGRATRALRAAEITGLRSAAEKSGLLNLLGDPGQVVKMAPRVGRASGLKNLARLAEAGQPARPAQRVAYFVGCFAAYLDFEEAAATVRTLQRQNVHVSVPPFGCCGIPAPAYGDRRSARTMASRNIALARNLKVDAIVTSCASCGSFLKEYGKLFKEDAETFASAQEFSGKVRDLSEFLTSIGVSPEMGTLKEKITYHDPCHQSRYQKIKQQPRKILKNIPGVEFVEMNEADMCCGAAGSYGFKNFDLSMKVLDRKMENIARTGATLVASSCPACIMQLRAGSKRRNTGIRTLSVVKLLDEAYRQKPHK